MRILYHNRSRNAALEAECGATLVELDHLLENSDYVRFTRRLRRQQSISSTPPRSSA